jgi:nucleoid-associated protein YgaU
VVLGSGRVQLRRPTRTRVYRPIRGYRLPRNENDPAPAAVVALLGLALVVVLIAAGMLGTGPVGEAVGGVTATPTPSASPTQVAEATPSPEPTEEPAEDTPRPTDRVHVVQKGENLTKIAEQYGVTVKQIVEANDLDDPSQISVGQELKIPAPA